MKKKTYEQEKKAKLAIVTGVTGKLGETYLERLAKLPNVKCIGFARRNPEEKYDGVEYKFADLLKKSEIQREISRIDVKKFSEIVFIHPVGMFKFELAGFPGHDLNKDGIDDEVFSSNVLTFLHVFRAIKKKARENDLRLTVCAFGSISDKYHVPFWASYTKSKNKLRRIIKFNAVHDRRIRGIFVNVSTTDTGNERNLRPCADREYWLKTEEIVRASLPIILNKKEKWCEINVYKPHPDFNSTWYTNHENVLNRWKNQMNLVKG